MPPWLRSILAVLGGFFTVAILSVGTDAVMHATGVFPPVDVRMSDAMFVIPGVYRAAFTGLGGYLTAVLAPSRPMVHAAVLTGLGILGGLGGIAAWSAGGGEQVMGPFWYVVSIPLSAVPCIMGGAWAGARRPAPPA